MSNTARLIYEGPNKILPIVAFELSKFSQLAIPMFFSQLAGHATGIIAALMTGNYSTIDQAAVATGNMFFFPISMGLMGTLFIVTAMVAQNFGANTLENVGKIIRQSFWVSIPLIILGIWLDLILLFGLIFMALSAFPSSNKRQRDDIRLFDLLFWILINDLFPWI